MTGERSLHASTQLQKKLNIFSEDIMTGLVCQQSAGLLDCWTAGLEEIVLLYFVHLLVGKLRVSGYCA